MTLEAVQPGETRRMQFSIPVEELRFYDVISQSLMVKELMPYIGILVLALVLMVFFPQIVMFLPNLVGG